MYYSFLYQGYVLSSNNARFRVQTSLGKRQKLVRIYERYLKTTPLLRLSILSEAREAFLLCHSI